MYLVFLSLSLCLGSVSLVWIHINFTLFLNGLLSPYLAFLVISFSAVLFIYIYKASFLEQPSSFFSLSSSFFSVQCRQSCQNPLVWRNVTTDQLSGDSQRNTACLLCVFRVLCSVFRPPFRTRSDQGGSGVTSRRSVPQGQQLDQTRRDEMAPNNTLQETRGEAAGRKKLHKNQATPAEGDCPRKAKEHSREIADRQSLTGADRDTELFCSSLSLNVFLAFPLYVSLTLSSRVFKSPVQCC